MEQSAKGIHRGRQRLRARDRRRRGDLAGQARRQQLAVRDSRAGRASRCRGGSAGNGCPRGQRRQLDDRRGRVEPRVHLAPKRRVFTRRHARDYDRRQRRGAGLARRRRDLEPLEQGYDRGSGYRRGQELSKSESDQGLKTNGPGSDGGARCRKAIRTLTAGTSMATSSTPTSVAAAMSRLPAAERITHGIARFTLRHRWPTLSVLLVITVFFAFHAVKVQMYSQFADLLPQAHPYIKAYNHFRTTFGGANIVSLSLRVKNGDIFNTDSLKNIRAATEKVDQIDGVNHYQVASLSHVKIRRLEARSGGLIKSVPVLPEQVPTDTVELKELKKAKYNNDIVYGKYLSTDGKAALILAGFNEERLDYGNIQHQIILIREHVEDNNTVLYAAGEPMLKGWVWFYTGELAEIFAVTFIFIFGTLIIYFRRLYGVLLPFIGAIAQAIWGLGFLGILGYNLDPLVLVIPLLVSARAASHGVQMVERYFEELEATGDKRHAVSIAMGELLLPGGIGVLADAAGILVLAVATIPLVRKLAFFASFWGFSNL